MLCKGKKKVYFFNGLTQVLILMGGFLILGVFWVFFETVRFLLLTRTVSNYGFKTRLWTRHNLQDLRI